ncbi:hypothetical protein SHELI_v1c06700 [Spiroplasma helicoides]|uniref:Transmembrane protein n=1 Tax=Spiroplasma helicoides TaxID=216938 RepID=A0A1B3SL08_9MOLU|nr:hypothetical protein [Spiroplasma helicoides]AOG60621.1 hypothetical protein SHELI_v1c06700 [Spiroplasma helicoides]
MAMARKLDNQKVKRGPLGDRLIHGFLGDFYTKIFLKSKHVNMVSEGDFLARVRCLCAATYILPFQIIWIGFFLYARIFVQKSLGSSTIVDSEDSYLYYDQINILNISMYLMLYHIFLLSTVIIVLLNQTMGKGTVIFTVIYNFLFISESLLYGSFLFILDWIGLLHKFTDLNSALDMLKTQWLWILAIVFLLWSYFPLISIFKDLNMWNREWMRIDRYRKTEDKENAFVFKTWVTPGEVKARKWMIFAGWLAIFISSTFELMDVFASTNYSIMKYIILGFGYIVFLGSYIVPYNKYSLIFYWLNQTVLMGILIYGLVIMNRSAHIPGNWFMYLYWLLIIPWILSFKSAIRYTWTIKDAEEIKAVVLNMFDNKDDFEKFLDKRKEDKKVDENSI